MNNATRTTVTINTDEITLIEENLKGAEKLSDFVHTAISEFIDKRRTEKGLVQNGGIA